MGGVVPARPLAGQGGAFLHPRTLHHPPTTHPPALADTGKASYKSAVLGKGLPASPGAAMGRVVFTAEEAEKWNKDGEKVRGSC